MSDDTPFWARMAENATMMIEGTPQAKALGVQFVGYDEARAIMHVSWRADLVGDPDAGVMASGVVTTLLDHTCGMAALAALGEPTIIATLDLRIDYMRPAQSGSGIRAEAHCYKVTRSVAFVRAFAFDEAREPGSDNDPVASAQAAFMLGSGKAGKASKVRS
jgi:uncharacterized protein (TIGR00369 family)